MTKKKSNKKLKIRSKIGVPPPTIVIKDKKKEKSKNACRKKEHESE